MIYTSVFLATTEYSKDSIGQEVEVNVLKEVPIIRVEDIYSTEFYEANTQGYKPELRLVISAIEYNNEQELTYGDTIYNVIRTQTPNIDEIVLICERKLKNVR